MFARLKLAELGLRDFRQVANKKIVFTQLVKIKFLTALNCKLKNTRGFDFIKNKLLTRYITVENYQNFANLYIYLKLNTKLII
jgi:hypothetical protein